MEKSLEDGLYQAVLSRDHQTVAHLLCKGADPNKTTSFGKTSLGLAANTGNLDIAKLLIEATLSCSISKATSITKKRHKSKKRKYHHGGPAETVVKYKNLNDRKIKDFSLGQCEDVKQDSLKQEKNQGYFVVIHSEGSSSDESKVSSILTASSLTPSPQSDLEWDEEIDNDTPVVDTSEDESWTSMYRWYAAILESTGAAIASASAATYGVDQQDSYMRTALHYAVERGHLDIVELLLKSGCKVDLTASEGLTALHIAAMENETNIAKMLLSAGSQVNNKTHEKITALHFAASRGYLDMVKVLVAEGANIESRDTNERTPLYVAVMKGHPNVVEYLISVGANVNSEEIHGYTPLCEAVWERLPDIVELLLKAGARITHSHRLIHNAIIQGQEPIVKMLAGVGGGINLHNDNGDTALLLAVRLSQLRDVRHLLAKGANINASNSITGANALHVAVECIEYLENFEELLECLIEHKIDMNHTALTGDTPLNRALLLHRDYAALLLIRHGADVNCCDVRKCGLDNLSIASRRRNADLVNLLIRAGHYLPYPEIYEQSPKPGSTAEWLQAISLTKQPLSLTDLCRIQIRRSCQNMGLFTSVNRLPLPTTLKRFLTMQDEYEWLINE
ncbi:ankyrin-1-like [Ostrinia furnacalis]|uniref:ankyrin-1-like n=1 Tax=Ostrinia furnacalis TaxID=93504 RepID=UPI0010398D4F|nr:ankyrin-1-like [Ostrinia furnacalis]